ncbi:MAG: APC family permease [Gemmatimonadota bacterium]
MTELKRQLGLLDATMINVGTIIASAIFIVPAQIALQLHATSLTVAVWVVGGVVSLLGALSIAELAAAMPEAGGAFVYLREAYGPVWGWLYGWANGVVVNPASIAAIAVGFAGYVGHFTPLSGPGVKAVAVASILALTALNVLGVKAGAITQNVLTLMKLAVVAALILAGFLLAGGSVANLQPIWPVPEGGRHLVGAFGVAMVAVLWAYDGWIETTYVGSEVKHPERNLPRSIITSALICMGLYVLVTLSYTYVLGPDRVAASQLVASDAARVTLGSIGAGFVVVGILVSTLGANNGIVLTAARIPYAMARDGLLFRFIGAVHARWLTPANSLLVQAGIAIALTITGQYDRLYTYVVFAQFLAYALMCGAVLRLRRRRPDLPRPYRAWGYPVTPLLFIGFSVWLVINTIREDPLDSAVGAGLILLGLPLYFYFKGRPSGIGYRPTAQSPDR